jgi:hypothetical protein
MLQKFYVVYFDQKQIDIFDTHENAVECVDNIQQDADVLYNEDYSDDRFDIVEQLLEVERI